MEALALIVRRGKYSEIDFTHGLLAQGARVGAMLSVEGAAGTRSERGFPGRGKPVAGEAPGFEAHGALVRPSV